MTRRFTKIGGGALWRSKRFTDLSSTDAKLLLFYFLTSEHMTSAGAYQVPDGYAIADLGWTMEQYRKARAELVSADLILFDDESSVVYVLRWFRHNVPMNQRHTVGTARLISEIPCDAVRERVEADFTEAMNVVPEPEQARTNIDAITSRLAAEKWPVTPRRTGR
jgi:hypothetical protein